MIGRDAAQSSLSDDARRVRYTLRVNHPPSPPQLRPPTFVEPMECLAVTKLPDGQQWLYEIKLDGYRAEAITSADNLAQGCCKTPILQVRRVDKNFLEKGGSILALSCRL